MIFEGLVQSRRDLIFIVLVTLLTFVGFWNSSFILPLLIAGGVWWIWVEFKSNGEFIPVYRTDLLIVSLLVIELFSFIFSVYPPNSFELLDKVLFIVLFYFFLCFGLKKELLKNLFCGSLGIYAVLLSSGALLTFFILKANLFSEGWMDASQFKAMFAPFGFRNNDWATIAVMLLPFPLIIAILFRSLKIVLWAGLFCFGLVVYSVLISFSRGAYLSLAVFVLVLIMGVVLLRLIKLKTWIPLALASGVMIAALTIPIYKPMMTTLSMNKTVSQQRSTKGRMETFRLAWCKVQDHWLTGTGSYNYSISGNRCTNISEDAVESIFTNNLYLQILIEKGLVGLLIYCLLFLAILVRYCRNLFRKTDPQEIIINLLLFAGFISYCFRELFFASLFECNPVLVLVGVYASLSHSGKSGSPLILKIDGGWSWIKYLLISILLFFASWLYYKKIQYNKAERLMNETVEAMATGSAAIEKVNNLLTLAPDIAPYHELAGLVIGQVNLNVQDLFFDSLKVDQTRIANAISHFNQAILLNPNDGGFHFNLAYLVYLQDQRLNDLASMHFNKALEIEPNNTEFLVGYGLLVEQSGDSSQAYQLYEKAIRLDPELIESEFFEDLGHRHPGIPGLLIDKSILALKQKLDSGYNSVFSARLGLLYWSSQNDTLAKPIFNRVVQDLPDLYRPYFYLGLIAEKEQDSLQARRLYQKSLYLSSRDYLAPLAMGNYYFFRLNGQLNTYYAVVRHYKNGLINLLQLPSAHRNLVRFQYKSGITISNDLILKNLIPATRIKIDFKTISLRLSEAYKKMDRVEMEAYYQKLSEKKWTDLINSDIQ